MDILTIGEVLIDLTQTGKDARGIPQFAANPGGAPANLAVAASRLGAQTAFIGKVGADAFGRYLKEVLAENKVDVSGMAVDADHPTTMAVVSVDATGERDFSFYRSAPLSHARPSPASAARTAPPAPDSPVHPPQFPPDDGAAPPQPPTPARSATM